MILDIIITLSIMVWIVTAAINMVILQTISEAEDIRDTLFHKIGIAAIAVLGGPLLLLLFILNKNNEED